MALSKNADTPSYVHFNRATSINPNRNFGSVLGPGLFTMWLLSLVLGCSAWEARTSEDTGSMFFVEAAGSQWNSWRSKHENPILAARQQLEWKELTLSEDGSITGLTGGLLRLGPFKELPSHFHPEPYGEIYHFLRGNGQVKLGEYTEKSVKHQISPGLHVNIPARQVHGIESGSEGCEFLWMFPAGRWKDIPYLYIDPKLTHRNVPDDFDVPLPLDVLDWGTVHANVTRVQRSITEELRMALFLRQLSCGWQGALDLLLQARERGIQVAVHQTVENLAEEARRGAEALRPFWDVAPSRRSLLSRWSHALDLFFQEMQLGQPQSLEDYRAAIKACPRFYWKLSLHLLERMSYEALGPDRLCYREAMRTCNRGLYSYEAAVSLFQDMSAQRLEPGVEEFNDLMLALITGNRWQEAFDIFLDMRSAASRSPKPNLQSFCMVLYACADTNEANAWASAIGYWSDMRKDKITPDFDAYDMLLLVAERSERWDWSRQLLDTLFKLNAPSTVTMFNAALNAARRGKRWELAQSLLREMSEELLLPTIVSYSFAVESCEQADRFDVATQLLQLVDELDLK
eukprot:s3428_g7.t1